MISALLIVYYRISGNIGDELNLAVWWLRLEPPNEDSPIFNTWQSLQVRLGPTPN